MTTRDPARPRASEVFLQRLNAAADTDVTVVLRCATAAQCRQVRAGILEVAGADPISVVGVRARRLEPVRRTPTSPGLLPPGLAPTGAGPFEIASPADDERRLILRWSHLAGDARTCQEVVLDGLERAGLLDDGPACRCVHLPTGAVRPMAAADAWAALRASGAVGTVDALRAGGPALLPLARPTGSPLKGPDPTGHMAAPVTGDDPDTDAVAVVRLPLPSSAPGRPSLFSSVAGSVAAMLAAPGRRSAVRLGVTVDIRRHERLEGTASAGNLALVGYVNVPVGARADRDATAAATHARVQTLLRRRFWRQQLAFDAWLQPAPPAVVERACDVVVNRLAALAPVTVSELWRDDGLTCPACGRARRRLPPDVEALVIPPALPPAGLTCGITRGPRSVTLVLRRLTRPGTSAHGWLAAAAARLPGGEVESVGAVRQSPS